MSFSDDSGIGPVKPELKHLSDSLKALVIRATGDARPSVSVSDNTAGVLVSLNAARGESDILLDELAEAGGTLQRDNYVRFDTIEAAQRAVDEVAKGYHGHTATARRSRPGTLEPQ